MYLQLLSFESNHKFTQMSWNFMNDSLRTDCFVRYQPETIACACIYLSARKLNIPLPRKPSWYELLGVEEDDIRDCCYRIICLYQRKKVNQEDLEKVVDKLKQIQEEKKKEAKLLSAANTAVNSPASQPTSPQRKRGIEDDRSRSRSRSNDRKKKKKHKKERSVSSDRGRDKLKKKKRDWSHSPIHKSRKHRSRSRERLSDRSRFERRSDRSEPKSYSEKYRKGERMDREYYRR